MQEEIFLRSWIRLEIRRPHGPGMGQDVADVAVEILKKNNDNFDYKVDWGCDLQTEHERYLTEQVYKRPVFVTDYPKDIKAFYMRLNDDGKTCP